MADNLSKAGWSLGYVSAVDCEGRTIWIADAHRDDGQRFVVQADNKLTAFLRLARYAGQFAFGPTKNAAAITVRSEVSKLLSRRRAPACCG